MLQIGIKGTTEKTVTQEMSAKNAGSGDLNVYATPAMIALAEETALKSVAPYLEDGCSTVGIKIEAAHIAATPIGMKVRCETELTQIDRRRLVFSFTVFDEAEKIGEGTHERFIIDAVKFQKKTDSKTQQ